MTGQERCRVSQRRENRPGPSGAGAGLKERNQSQSTSGRPHGRAEHGELQRRIAGQIAGEGKYGAGQEGGLAAVLSTLRPTGR